MKGAGKGGQRPRGGRVGWQKPVQLNEVINGEIKGACDQKGERGGVFGGEGGGEN